MSTENNQEKSKVDESVKKLVEEVQESEKTINEELAGIDQTLIDEITGIISEQLGIDAKEVTPEKAFGEDLAADSLDQTELIMALEEKYSLEISEQEAEQLKKVKDVICYVSTKTGQTHCRS